MTYRAVEIETGEVVFDRGDEGDCMFLIQAGEVEVLRGLDHDERPVAIFERGDFFGEMAILDNEKRSHAVRARARTKLVEIDAEGFSHMLTRNPEIAVRMIRKLSRRLAATEEKLVRTWGGEDVFGDGTHVAVQHRVRPRLVHLLEDDRPGQEFPLAVGEDTAVGRRDPVNGIEPGIDLTEIDAKLSTSRRHARFTYHDDQILLIEDQATNGTFVDGRRLEPRQPVALEGGEEIVFGAVRLRFYGG